MILLFSNSGPSLIRQVLKHGHFYVGMLLVVHLQLYMLETLALCFDMFVNVFVGSVQINVHDENLEPT